MTYLRRQELFLQSEAILGRCSPEWCRGTLWQKRRQWLQHNTATTHLLGFQECSANRIALVDDDDVQCMMKTLHK
jgi:hypothetical protein